MPSITHMQMQASIVALLLFGSLATLGFNIASTWVPPDREQAVRDELRAASSQMAKAAAALTGDHAPGASSPPRDEPLASISNQVLAAFPEVEGGFYLAASDRFGGFSHGGERGRRRDGPARSEPPPLETPLIRLQAQQSRELPAGDFLLTIRDVGPSRVAVLTEPVGGERPARLCTWLMVRLVDPAQLGTQVRRYQFSTAFALSGLLAAVLLAVNLARLARRQTAERQRLQEELRRSEHLAALGTLLAGLAHEVRNPLAAIRSTVQLWQRIPEAMHRNDSMNAVVHAVDRINELVTQLLVFSRVEPRVAEPLNIDLLLRDTLDLIAAQAAGQGVRIESHLNAAAPRVMGSAQSLRQVFLNLAANALQAMPTGGTLRCTSQWASQRVLIDFSDTGPGVPAQDQQHLFEPFYSGRAEGTGLGLAICREIVSQHHGQIEIVPGLTSGATFRVTLPISPAS